MPDLDIYNSDGNLFKSDGINQEWFLAETELLVSALAFLVNHFN